MHKKNPLGAQTCAVLTRSGMPFSLRSKYFDRIPVFSPRCRRCRSESGTSAARGSRRRARGGARLIDVSGDLFDELLFAPERPFVAQALPQLDDERPAVEITFEVEQERLDPPLAAAVVRVHPDRHRRTVTGGRPGVDAESRNEQVRVHAEIRGREAERPAPRISGHDVPLDLDGPPQQPRGGSDVAVVDELPDPR